MARPMLISRANEMIATMTVLNMARSNTVQWVRENPLKRKS